MKCDEYQRMINKFIDHELKAAECSAMFDHLGTCMECRQFYDSINALGTELDKIPFPNEEVTFRQSGWSKRQPTYSIADHKRIAPRPSTLAVAIIVLLVVGLLFSVNVTIEKPAQPMPSALTIQR